MHTAARLKVSFKLESELADHHDYSKQFQPEESTLDVTPHFCLYPTLRQLLRTAHMTSKALYTCMCVGTAACLFNCCTNLYGAVQSLAEGKLVKHTQGTVLNACVQSGTDGNHKQPPLVQGS